MTKYFWMILPQNIYSLSLLLRNVCVCPELERDRVIEERLFQHRINLTKLPEQFTELQEILAQDLDRIVSRYKTQIQQCDEDILEAEQRYESALRIWKEERKEVESNLAYTV